MLDALILGIVEGFTEFLPISSTGHLILVGNLLGFTGEKAATFEVFIQLGAILAVLVLYQRRFTGLFSTETKGLAGIRGLKLLAITTVPAVIAGFLLHGIIKAKLFNPFTVAIGLLVGGVIIIVVERWHKPTEGVEIDDISEKQALKVGLFQLLALWPGFSRAGATIIGGRLVGLSDKAAVEYSFLAAVPLMIAAVGYDLVKSIPALSTNDIGIFFVGFVAAFLSALVAIKFLVAIVSRYSLAPFGWYRIELALMIFLVLAL